MHELHSIQIEPIIQKALEEDWGYGDWTTDLCVEADRPGRARIICKEATMVAGVDVAAAVFHKVDPQLNVQIKAPNGTAAENRTELLFIEGRARSILKAERVALNLMARMCGIATLTRELVKALEGTRTQLLDTRKTTPGLRILEKSATVIGGARNHRFGLCDGVIVKENHIRAAGGITAALGRLHESLPPTLKIEVETTNLDEVKEALSAGADIIMLDNMSVEMMKEAVALINGKALVEASGNVRLHNIRDIAQSGVDFISTSSVITGARWSDLSLLFDV
jgi:nicotinate-nucleotide pyrophosphorylase (carboxylating)